MLAEHLTGCPNPQSTSFRPFWMCTTARTIQCNFWIRSGRQCPYFRYVSRHTPHACNCVKTCSERARTKLCPSFAFVFHLGISFFVPLIVACGFPYREGVEAPVAIVHHRDSHSNVAWRPIPQPRQTGSPEGGYYRAGEVLRKSTRGNYGKRVSRTTQKTAHRASHRVHRVPYLPLWSVLAPTVCVCWPHLVTPIFIRLSPAHRGCGGVQGGWGGWHKASVSGCLPLAAPIGRKRQRPPRGGGGPHPPPKMVPHC